LGANVFGKINLIKKIFKIVWASYLKKEGNQDAIRLNTACEINAFRSKNVIISIIKKLEIY
jgi:hypothetical protein